MQWIKWQNVKFPRSDSIFQEILSQVYIQGKFMSLYISSQLGSLLVHKKVLKNNIVMLPVVHCKVISR